MASRCNGHIMAVRSTEQKLAAQGYQVEVVPQAASTAYRNCPASLAGDSAAHQACLVHLQLSEDLRRAVLVG